MEAEPLVPGTPAEEVVWRLDDGPVHTHPQSPPTMLDRVIPLGGARAWQTAGLIAVIVAALALTIVAMPFLGFLVAGTLFAATIVLMSGGKWLSAIIFSPIASAGIYYLFMSGFRVPLPRGILG